MALPHPELRFHNWRKPPLQIARLPIECVGTESEKLPTQGIVSELCNLVVETFGRSLRPFGQRYYAAAQLYPVVLRKVVDSFLNLLFRARVDALY